MQIIKSTSVTSTRTPAEYFSGTVWRDELITLPGAGAIRLGRVTFAPGGRTAWHTHPLGQTLHVLSGVGRVQRWGEAASVVIQAGDTVHIPAEVKHWHGAAAGSMMTHLAIQQTDGEKDIVWLEQVNDEQYAAAQ